MLKLSIVRHAKSSWENPELDDFDRPLLEKGIKRTGVVINYLLDKALVPDLIMTSPAKRAVETAKIMQEQLNVKEAFTVNNELYPGDLEGILNEMAEILPAVNHLMIIGHNPGLTDLALELTDDERVEWIPTSGVVHIEFDMPGWELIVGAKGTVKELIVPKKLLKKLKKNE
jgi:phosphohistidine phosphatase